VSAELAALAVAWVVIVIQRLVELRVSARHERALAARGGREIRASGFGLLAAAHAIWLVAWPLETVGLATRPPAAWPALALLFAAAEALRLWAIASLGDRWTVRVVRVAGEPLVAAGPYRLFRHPNYLAVAAQVLILPLAFGAWRSALLGLVLYLFGLARRLPVEERALASERPRPLDPRTTRP
jgi:methyltransferase